MVKDPWFRPLYRRVLTLLVLGGWGVFEWLVPLGVSFGGELWLIFVAALFAYAFWGFFLSGYYSAQPPGDGTEGAADDGQSGKEGP